MVLIPVVKAYRSDLSSCCTIYYFDSQLIVSDLGLMWKAYWMKILKLSCVCLPLRLEISGHLKLHKSQASRTLWT